MCEESTRYTHNGTVLVSEADHAIRNRTNLGSWELHGVLLNVVAALPASRDSGGGSLPLQAGDTVAVSGSDLKE